MSENDSWNQHIGRWVRLMNKGHGYAGVFNSENSNDKRIVETSTIEEWLRSIKADFGVGIGTSTFNPNDPPDFVVEIDNKSLSVELVQMVDQEHKRRATKGETPFAGQLFKDMQWSPERLVSKLRETIYRKGEKYKKAGIDIDVLLIHTAETWLTSTDATTWLEGVIVEAHPSIRSVFLLFEYDPGSGKDHWPVLSVYGELP